MSWAGGSTVTCTCPPGPTRSSGATSPDDGRAVARLRSGRTITVDTVSHEELLEDQGRDPVAWFGSNGVPGDQALEDAVAIAQQYARHPRNFDVDGPHDVHRPGVRRGCPPLPLTARHD
jgi:hypothetical protein